MKAVPDQLAPWLTGRLVTLGTDGFGRSDNREHLRRHFEVNAESIVAATLSKLARIGKFDTARARGAFAELGLDTEKGDPARTVIRFRSGFPQEVAPQNECGPVMRGSIAQPWSKTLSRTKGTSRNLGDLAFGRARYAAPVRMGKVMSRSL